jgi:hypothetical protein
VEGVREGEGGLSPQALKSHIIKMGIDREMWLYAVIQATWEARAVGWFEVE